MKSPLRRSLLQTHTNKQKAKLYINAEKSKFTYMKIIFTLALYFTLYSLQAQTLQKTLLWKISGNKLEKPSYLYGTMHAVCDATLDKNVEKAFDETSQLYLEIDMDDPNLQANMFKDMMMRDGKKMSEMVSPNEMALLDKFLTENVGYSGTMLNTVKPFFVNAMLIPKLLPCEMKTVEGELMTLSMKQNEPVFGLETVTEQIQVFDAIPYQNQMDDLLTMAKDGIDKSKAEFSKILDIYATKDIETMLQFTKKSESQMMSQFQDDLLLKRNENWIPRISKIANEKPTFFGVGAAHLAGDKGVIKLLRKAGFTVEPVL